MIRLAPEQWSDELTPILRRAASGKRADKWLDGIVAAIRDKRAVLFVARHDGRALALMVVAFQPVPLATAHVLALAAVPHSGVHWGRAGLAALATLARAAGAEEISAEALDVRQRRRLAFLGFAERSTVMVLPC